MVTYANPFAFIMFGMANGLAFSVVLHVVFTYVGVGKAFSSDFLGG